MQPELTREELLRYSRHLILPELGLSGQEKLKAAKVLLVGVGGLGSPATLYLAAAGVGHVGIVDFDVVDITNLHRQVVHGTSDVGRSKLDSAADSIASVNPNVRVTKHETPLTSENALDIISQYDLVLDGTDNFPTRYLVNDACAILRKQNMYGSIFRFDGQATVFCAKEGPCYRCLYPEPPPPGMVPNCADAGVLGVLPGVIGMIQATEAVKAILGIGEPLVGRLLLYDALGMSFREVRIKRDPACPVCGDHPTVTALIDYHQFCGLPKQGSTPFEEGEIGVAELTSMRSGDSTFCLIDVREPFENATNRIPGSILIPLTQLESRSNELDRSIPTVLYCRSGNRSGKALELLRRAGFENMLSLRGGILEWIKSEGDIEP